MQYPKIDSLFIREEQTKKLLSTFRDPFVDYLANCEWVFTEKVDGTNIRVYWDGYTISFKGRTDKAQIPTHLDEKLSELFLTTEMEEMFEQTFENKEVVLYGEGYGKKIQKEGELYGDTDFILFDIMVGNTFLNKEYVKQIGESLGLKVVPVVYRGTIYGAIDFVKEQPTSRIAERPKKMEGVVGTPAVRLHNHKGYRIMTKIKCEDFE